MTCGEFSLIARYFDCVKGARLDVETGIDDDCALLNISEKKMLAISTGTLVAGNHFLPNIDPTNLAYKALVVNLSDLTVMDTEPVWFTLALTLPEMDETWLEVLNDGLFVQLDYYGMQLIGGDTIRGPLPMTLGIHGLVLSRRAMKRAGAKPGDWVHVTGVPGDSTTSLATLQNRLMVDEPSNADYLLARCLRPIPCMLQGQALYDLATSVINLSDGLISGLGHVLKASGYGTYIDLDAMPYSDAILRQVKSEQALHRTLIGGEDYGLCFTVSELDHGALDVALGHLDTHFTCTGQVAPESEGLQFIRDGKPVALDLRGYDHLAQSRRGATLPEHA